MTALKLKKEIQKALDDVPESALPDILNYLKELRTKSKDTVELSRHLKKILSEDKKLLEKLAR